MKNLAKTIAVATVGLSLSASALAEASMVATSSELNYAFDNSQDLQMVVMSDKEMQETEGAWVANAIGGVLGAVGGHFGYMAGSVASGKYSAGGHVAAVGAGAAGGAMNPVAGLGSAVATFGGTAAITGGATYVGNKSSTVNIRR